MPALEGPSLLCPALEQPPTVLEQCLVALPVGSCGRRRRRACLSPFCSRGIRTLPLLSRPTRCSAQAEGRGEQHHCTKGDGEDALRACRAPGPAASRCPSASRPALGRSARPLTDPDLQRQAEVPAQGQLQAWLMVKSPGLPGSWRERSRPVGICQDGLPGFFFLGFFPPGFCTEFCRFAEAEGLRAQGGAGLGRAAVLQNWRVAGAVKGGWGD